MKGFCRECRYYGWREGGWGTSYCKKNFETRYNNECPFNIYSDPREKNRNNDCKDFELRRWIKFIRCIVNFFKKN